MPKPFLGGIHVSDSDSKTKMWLTLKNTYSYILKNIILLFYILFLNYWTQESLLMLSNWCLAMPL